MLKEITGLRQDEPALQRRWFHDDYFDLFVWQTEDGELHAFELCYGTHSSERALVWRAGQGFYHDGPLPAGSAGSASEAMAARFQAAAGTLPARLRAALDARIAEYLALRDRLPARRKAFRRADWQRQEETR